MQNLSDEEGVAAQNIAEVIELDEDLDDADKKVRIPSPIENELRWISGVFSVLCFF